MVRLAWFLFGVAVPLVCAAGFAVAALGGYAFIRGDVMQVAQDIEDQIIPVTVTLQSRIGRLEKRMEELEAANAKK